MAKARRSGITVNSRDVPLILAMVSRGDRRHDIAAWFGLNQGRIKEVEDGDHGTPPTAAATSLPPAGSPGPRARNIRHAVEIATKQLKKGNAEAALSILEKAAVEFDKNE